MHCSLIYAHSVHMYMSYRTQDREARRDKRGTTTTTARRSNKMCPFAVNAIFRIDIS